VIRGEIASGTEGNADPIRVQRELRHAERWRYVQVFSVQNMFGLHFTIRFINMN